MTTLIVGAIISIVAAFVLTLIDAAIGSEFDTDTLDQIENAVLEAAPLDTWSLVGLDYESTAITTDEFWAIVEKVAA